MPFGASTSRKLSMLSFGLATASNYFKLKCVIVLAPDLITFRDVRTADFTFLFSVTFGLRILILRRYASLVLTRDVETSNWCGLSSIGLFFTNWSVGESVSTANFDISSFWPGLSNFLPCDRFENFITPSESMVFGESSLIRLSLILLLWLPRSFIYEGWLKSNARWMIGENCIRCLRDLSLSYKKMCFGRFLAVSDGLLLVVIMAV